MNGNSDDPSYTRLRNRTEALSLGYKTGINAMPLKEVFL